MIFEQAFMALPEFLTGTPFKRYQFEGTIVTAYSMAVLQELNSRNVANPVSLLRSEVDYPVDERKRADMHINLGPLGLFNDDLHSYGFYENNWMEVKFCRLSSKGKPVTNPLASTFLLLKDLIRICSFPPDNKLHNEPSNTGRYLLHAYQGEPAQYFNFTRNQGGSRVERVWAKSLIKPGEHELEINDLSREKTKQFEKCVGRKARHIKLKAKVTNYVHKPRQYSDDVYHVVLTRVDDFKIYVFNRMFGRVNGKTQENRTGFGLLGPKIVNHYLTE